MSPGYPKDIFKKIIWDRMGGHSAWRKRLKAGLLAKGAGGAICRHRPHLGRKGKDIEKGKKGNIRGGPNKKKKNRKQNMLSGNAGEDDLSGTKEWLGMLRLQPMRGIVITSIIYLCFIFYRRSLVRHSDDNNAE